MDCSVYIRRFNNDIGGYVDTPAVSSDGIHIKGSTTFVADGSEGIVDVALKGDISQDVTGKMLVIYEKNKIKKECQKALSFFNSSFLYNLQSIGILVAQSEYNHRYFRYIQTRR